MYNRYISPSESYEKCDNQQYSKPTPRERVGDGWADGGQRVGDGWAQAGKIFKNMNIFTEGGGLGQLGKLLSPILEKLHLENLDSGDILLGLILLLLILEDGDNLDLIITLGLVILFSLSEP